MNKQFRLQYKYVNVINKIKTIVFTPIYIYIYVLKCYMSFFSKRQILFIECNNQNLIILESCATSSTGCPCSPKSQSPLPYINYFSFVAYYYFFFFFFLILLLLFLFLFFLSFFVHAHTDHQFHNENNFKSQSENFWNLLNSIGII